MAKDCGELEELDIDDELTELGREDELTDGLEDDVDVARELDDIQLSVNA